MTFSVINCIPEPAFPALLPHCMRFIRGSGWEQLLFITIDRSVSFLWPTPQFDILCTWPCPTSSGLRPTRYSVPQSYTAQCAHKIPS